MLSSVLIDALAAAGCYMLAYRLRFPGADLAAFLPRVIASLPLIVSGQLAGLWLAGCYQPRLITEKIGRLILGAAAGTAAAVALIGVLLGFAGLSRSAFALDLGLLIVAVIGWRAARVLRMEWRSSRRTAATPSLIDRTTEVATLVPTLVSVFSYRELLRNLVLKDLKLKYRGSILGFLWSLVNPLAMVAVYTLAFTYIIRTGQDNFAFFFILGLLPWTFFSGSALMSTGAIVDNAGLIKAVRFPRAILPISTVLFNLVQYLLTAAVIVPLMLLITGTPPAWAALAFPIVLTLQVAFTVGVALALSAATTFFRDIRHLLDIGLGMLFWLTPIVYRLDTVPEPLNTFVALGPVTPFVVGYQMMFYDGVWPARWIWILAAVQAAGALTVGMALFLSVEDQFGEQL